MSNSKLIGGIAIGMLVGAFGTASIAAMKPSQQQGAQRLTWSRANSITPVSSFNTYFILDSDSDACWLAVMSGNPDTPVVALAPAPSSSCHKQ
jgi:hypothetical protein